MTTRSLSWSTRQVLSELLTHSEGCYGYELSKRTGVRSGTLYPTLARLAEAGLTTSYFEDDAEPPGRPRRRYHKLTGEGVLVARDAAREAARIGAPALGPSASC
jgi:DNA-binding PadR family transcriptional regulator